MGYSCGEKIKIKITILYLLQDSQTKRTLTLISKTIQSLGNLVSSPSLQKEYKKEYKEEYMACVFDSVYTESRVLAVRQVLYLILLFFSFSNLSYPKTNKIVFDSVSRDYICHIQSHSKELGYASCP